MSENRKYFTRRDYLKLLVMTGTAATLSACTGQQIPTKNPVPASVQSTQLPSPTFPPVPTSVSNEKPANTPTIVPQASPTNPAPTKVPVSTPQPTAAQATTAYIGVARGPDPARITRAAIAALGGINQFVKNGNDVVIKPNICIDSYDESRAYEFAATTNPVVVATLVQLCREAGAKKVRVMDMPFGGTQESAYQRSGIKKAVEEAGGVMELMAKAKYKKIEIPDGKEIKEWIFYADLFTADVIINVPIAKHHNLAKLTLGGKNLLGVISRPNEIHASIGQRIADLISRVKPTLTVIDAVRIMVQGGPTGGSLSYVKKMDTVIASKDIVAADAYATTLFDYKGVKMKGEDIAYIKAAADMGLGSLDLKSLKIEEISVA
ncbi:MAG TPA: DUF362 domain-containing protein [Anaerolineaceae bacterium]